MQQYEKSGFELCCITGENAGVVFELDSGSASIGNEFALIYDTGFWIAHSIADKAFLLGSELTCLSLIEPGDIIVSKSGEYRFQKKQSVISSILDRSHKIGLGLLIVCSAIALVSVALHTEDDLQKSDTAMVVPDAILAETEFSGLQKMDPEKKLVVARSLLAVARGNAGQNYMLESGAAASIRQYQKVEKIMSSLPVVPEEIEIVREELSQIIAKHKAEKDLLKRNAVAALQADRTESFKACLMELITLIDDPSDMDYMWAIGQIRKITEQNTLEQ